MSVDVTIITATLPERAGMLAELEASIGEQTVKPAAWLIEEDDRREGPAVVLNRLAEQVRTTWLMPMGDDDLLDPTFFETLAVALDDPDPGVVYCWPRVIGSDQVPETAFQRPFNGMLMRWANGVCGGAACVRTDLWRRLGGYRPEPGWTEHEDWDLWNRAIDAGVEFRCVPKVRWTYRVHGGNISVPRAERAAAG